jgi:hypothetical protein
MATDGPRDEANLHGNENPFSTPDASEVDLIPRVTRIPPKPRYDPEDELEAIGKRMVKQQKGYFITLLLIVK